MKQRDLDALKSAAIEGLQLDLPFSFLSDGEAVTLRRHPTGEAVFYTDGETVYQHGTGRPMLYLGYDGVTVHRFGDSLAVYWAHENFLYAYGDPPGHGPALYFDPSGQQEQRANYEKRVEERERLLQELRAFDERAANRPIDQQEQQMASSYRERLRRLLGL